MPRRKQSKEEILQKAKISRKIRYAKIKADPALYALEKEKERQRYLKRKEQKKILTIEEMTPRSKRQQRKKWRENFKNHYRKIILQKQGIAHMNANTPSCSDSEDPLRDNIIYEENQEPAKPDNHDPNKASPLPPITTNVQEDSDLQKMKRRLRRLQYSVIKRNRQYQLHIDFLERKVESYKKIILRLKKKMQSPNSKANTLLTDKSKMQEAKKKILFGEAMKNTLLVNYSELQSKKDKKKFSDAIVNDRTILKNYKVLSETKKFTVRDKNKTIEKENHYEKLKQDIQNFFERDDVSRITSGKKDYITRDKIKKQKRYLLDSMKDLHKIFEQQFSKISYSYFCKQRPFWVLIPDVNERDTCLCKVHANIQLLIQALNKRKILKEKDTKDVIHSLCCSKLECLLKQCNMCNNKKLDYGEFDNEKTICYRTWETRKERYISKGLEKVKRVIVKTEMTTSPKEAIEELNKTIPKFLKHEGTRRWQFNAMKDLKANLKNNEAIIHIDFSENYALKYESEVQAFHFGGSRQELTLHTAVIYFINETGEITSQSFCSVSENLRHDAAAIWAHIVPILEYVQSANINVDSLHFLSDSPSSQYRNKTMFHIISKLCWDFRNLKFVSWNYTESGHGKGAADGVGGTIKRIADAAVAQGKDVATFDSFMRIVAESAKKIKLETVMEYKIYEKDLLINKEKLLPLKDTIKVHQVLWQKGKQDLIFREVSCFMCLDMNCNHTKFVGKLNYSEETDKVVNRVNNNSDIFVFPHTVEPKRMVFQMSQSSKQKLNNKPRPKIGKENLQILSNVLIKPKSCEDVTVTRLCDIIPDSKLHLQSDININDMVSVYNISTDNVNFSSCFEDFVRSSESLKRNMPDFGETPQDDLNLSESQLISLKSQPKINAQYQLKASKLEIPKRRGSTSDTDSDFIFEPIVSKDCVRSPKSFKQYVTSSGETSEDDFMFRVSTPKLSTLKNIKKETDCRQIIPSRESESDDDLEIFSRKKVYFQ